MQEHDSGDVDKAGEKHGHGSNLKPRGVVGIHADGEGVGATASRDTAGIARSASTGCARSCRCATVVIRNDAKSGVRPLGRRIARRQRKVMRRRATYRRSPEEEGPFPAIVVVGSAGVTKNEAQEFAGGGNEASTWINLREYLDNARRGTARE